MADAFSNSLYPSFFYGVGVPIEKNQRKDL